MLKKRSVIWYIMLICAIVCSVILLVGRISSEMSSKSVCAAIKTGDVELLSRKSGIPVDEWESRLGKVGVRYFADGLSADSIGALPLIEDLDRRSLVLPGSVDIENYDGDMVRTLYLYYRYGARVVDGDPQEIEDVLFRAVMDRGQRLLVITPFYDSDGNIVSDISVYEQCLEDLDGRLTARGIDYGSGYSVFKDAYSSKYLIFGAGLAPVLLGAWLLCLLLRKKQWETPVALIAAALVFAATMYNAELAQKMLMLASAILFPSAFSVFIYSYAKQEPQRLQGRPIALRAFTAVLITAACGLLGGLSVAALMTSRPYLVGYVIFSGVKLALLAPLAVAGVLLVIELISEKMPKKKLIRTGIICAVIIIIAGAVMVLRSGDVSSHAPGMDKVIAVRNWFEHNLYVRPRSKEMFAAVPCVIIFVWACRRRLPALKLIGGMGTALECVSVVNTFCHAVAAIEVSLIRTLLAIGIGLVLGFIALGICELIYRACTKKKTA